MSDELETLRDEIRALDRQLVEVTARRLELARRVGDVKRDRGLPIRNYVVEAEAIKLARDLAEKLGVRPDSAEEMLKLEIRESLRVQEQDRAAKTRAASTGARALVIGGAGNMGRWFVEFLESKGYDVAVSDPRGGSVKDVASEAQRADLVIVATPPSATASVLSSLKGARGIVMDIASLKAPHAEALRALAASGTRATSLHPMWGPKADLLAGRNVVVCDCGSAEANAAGRALFADTAANIVELPLGEHDRFMGLVLGLPHAVSLLFAHALAEQPLALDDVTHLGGPTFQKQVAVAREVASENKDLYYEIQKLNPHTPDVLQGLRRSLDALEASLAAREEFRAYMSRGESWFTEASR